MKSEAFIQNEIRIALSPHAIIFRTNAGEFWQGRRVYSKEFKQMVLINLKKIDGLPKGHSDLAGIRKSDGKAIYIEVKREDGVVKPEQKHFIATMQEYNALAGVARSVEDALRIVGDN